MRRSLPHFVSALARCQALFLYQFFVLVFSGITKSVREFLVQGLFRAIYRLNSLVFP